MKNRVTRRSFIVMTAVAFAAPPARGDAPTLSAPEAHSRAATGDLLLLDIRTPAEWRRTGVGASAQPLSMHRPGFIARLDKLTGGDRSKPIALICAVGGRSSALQKTLGRVGYSNVADVPEGMVGGVNGPGWIARGLPVESYPSEAD